MHYKSRCITYNITLKVNFVKYVLSNKEEKRKIFCSTDNKIISGIINDNELCNSQKVSKSPRK